MTGAPPPPPPGAPPPPPGSAHPPPPPPPFGVASGPPGASPSRNGLAVASMVLGIISVPMCFLFIPGVLAVIFGIIALSQINGNPGQAGRGQAIAGLVLGGVSVALIILLIALGPALDIESSSAAFV